MRILWYDNSSVLQAFFAFATDISDQVFLKPAENRYDEFIFKPPFSPKLVVLIKTSINDTIRYFIHAKSHLAHEHIYKQQYIINKHAG